MEALERRSLLAIAAFIYIIFCTQCGVVSSHRNSTRMSYVCPPGFVRLGHSCYYFSDKKTTWQNALFSCKDRESSLSVPARWEDRNLRNYLNKPNAGNASRWIGGIYDYSSKAWKWGGELRRMHYQSFSKMEKKSPEELQWHCIAMEARLKYRWAAASCYEPRQYICQTKLLKVPKSSVKELRRRWLHMGKPNEITVPSVSREVNDRKANDVTVNPLVNPKSYDLQPSPLRLRPNSGRPLKAHRLRPSGPRKRSRPIQSKLRKPFPGYQWNRRNPEASYQYNANLLRSGKTGLTRQQVNSYLVHLQHMRDRQIQKRRKLQEKEEWLVNDGPPQITKARTYTVDNNISALHPKTIVEEIDMLPPPPPPVPITRLTRGTYRGYH